MAGQTIDLNKEFSPVSSRLGSNQGGFFKRKRDSAEFYIKWLSENNKQSLDRIKNEYLALKLYELFGVAVPKAELISFTDSNGVKHVGIATAKKEGIKSIRNAFQSEPQTFEKVKKKAQEDFLIDAFLSNYDVVGLAMDNLHYDATTGEPFRIDPGGALRYRAQGGDKWEKGQFDDKVGEFEDMESGDNKSTKYNQYVLKQASYVFKGVHSSEEIQVGLRKLQAVSDQQIRDCVNAHFYDPTTKEGSKANEAMIQRLLARKQNLINKAEKHISPYRKEKASAKPLAENKNTGVDQATTKATLSSEGPQIAIQPLLNALEEISRKVDKLQEKYSFNRSKYHKVYHAAKELRDNLKHNLALYTQKNIGPLTYTGLNHLHINHAQPLLENKVSGWGRKFFGSLSNAVNRFFSFIGVVERSFENELADFQGKVRKLKALLQKPNQEKLANYLVKLNPSNLEVIAACNQVDNRSIKEAMPAAIVELIDKGVVTPSEAIQAFPENEQIIEKVEKETRFNGLQTEQDVIRLVNTGQLNPFMATKKYPDHPAVVEAAYKKNPASLKNASKEAINKLGVANIIKTEDVLSAYSIEKPSQASMQKITNQFTQAKKKRNWAQVAAICNSDKFWFEKPEGANHERVVVELVADARWQDLHNFESTAKEEDYQLTYGPLNKTPETYQLEALFLKMMRSGNFKVKTIENEDYFVFEDGTQFNWTKIREKADWQHIDLGAVHFNEYAYYMNSDNKAECKLDPALIDHYLYELYRDQTIPAQPINFQQMQAVNIYSGSFYKSMNGLMRGEIDKFNYRNEWPAFTRDALIHSVMCASALRMLPTTPIKKSYRNASFGTAKDQQQRIQAAANKGVIKLDGFVSSSTKSTDAPYLHKDVRFTFKNLRGAYIAPIAYQPKENEFLIPPTQVQVTHYKKVKDKHQFEASLVSELGPQNNEELAYLLVESSALSSANPITVSKLVEKGNIPAERAIKAFPQNTEVILAAYNKEPLTLTNVDVSIVDTLVKSRKITLDHALQAFPENEPLISYGLGEDITAVAKYASPEKLIAMVRNNAAQPYSVLKAMPNEEKLILACYAQDKTSIVAGEVEKIAELVRDHKILPSDALAAFPYDENIITSCYHVNPASINNVAVEHILNLIDKKKLPDEELTKLVEANKIKLEDIINSNNYGGHVTALAYKMEPSFIAKESSEKIIALLEKGIISPAAAISAFPDNVEVIKKAEAKAGTLIVHLEKELVELINKGQLSPYQAVELNPKNIAIVEAAYKKDPASIKHASKEVINTLGAKKVIKAADVLQVFSISMPTETELQQTINQCDKALEDKDWVLMAKMCDKFWFERPPQTNREDIVNDLNLSSEDLYNFEIAMKKEEYQLTYGPIQKSPETYQLEALFRKMMTAGDFTLENSKEGDYFVFRDGARFNWTKIRAGADFQHIELNSADFALYDQYEKKNLSYKFSTINPSNESIYRAQLYAGQEIPADPIRLAEMQAINIYTKTSFFARINGLMRDEIHKFDYRIESHDQIRFMLIHSVLCASGLRKIPMTDIKVSYRGASLGSNTEQHKKVRAAATQGVIELDGFVSSSIVSDRAFDKGIFYTFKNLRGAFIAPISYMPQELEFLIPPTQVQLTSFKMKDNKYYFEGDLVSELGVKKKENVSSLVIPKETVLNFAKPHVVINLLEKGEVLPARAVEAFPEHKQMVLAAFKKDPDSIQYASPSLIESLEKENAQKKLPKAESYALLDAKLFKIKHLYAKEESTEHLIRELSKASCKTSTLSISHFSENTKKAKYVIDRIANNKELCEAFGVDYTKPKEVKTADIKKVLYRAFNDKPLFTEKGEEKGSKL